MPSLCATHNFPSAWAGFAPKLTTAPGLTTTLAVAHVAFLRRTLTNLMDHGDAIEQHVSSVQILADVFDACSNRPLSWNLIVEIGTAFFCPSKAKSVPSCCTMLTSAIQLTAASHSVASTTTSSSAKNFVLTTNQVFKKPTYEGLKLTVTIRWCGNGPQDGETSGFESSLLVILRETRLPSLPLLLLSCMATS